MVSLRKKGKILLHKGERIMDDILLPILVFVFILLFFLGLFLTNPIFKIKVLRALTKKDYILIHYVNSDKKTIHYKIINPTKDIYTIGDSVWIADKGRIYRQDSIEKGFSLKNASPKFVEGVPVVFVDEDYLRPIDFYEDKDQLQTSRISGTLQGYIDLEVQKRSKKKSFEGLIIIIILLLSLLCVGMSFTNMNTLTEIQNKLNNMPQQTAQSTTQTPPNSTIIINGSVR